ncbi:MAG: methyltransferase domain-containing protein, partial [Acetivibrio sp.]
MTTYIKENKKTYDEAYENGWGNSYPDSMWVSLYHSKIKKLLNQEKKPIRVLDFGCSLGANTRFFADLGFEVYGIDISEEA